LGLEKIVVPLSQTSRFSFWASAFSFSLAQWARDQASHLPTKSLKEQTKSGPECPKCKVESKFFSSPVYQ